VFEDKTLKADFNRGAGDVISCIYEKYKDDLLRLAVALLHDEYLAEDVLNDSLVALAKSIGNVRLTGNLRSYLATCVANHARNMYRARRNKKTVAIEDAAHVRSPSSGPEQSAVLNEEYCRVKDAMAKLPYEQREVIVLHLRNGITFKEIAGLQNVSINTCTSRYRCGLGKLRSLLNSEVKQ
jgi:RNA polymerase sigma-70 factor (ECF subfamily)